LQFNSLGQESWLCRTNIDMEWKLCYVGRNSSVTDGEFVVKAGSCLLMVDMLAMGKGIILRTLATLGGNATMKSITRITIICIFQWLIFSFFIVPQLGAQQIISTEVIKAAQEGLSHYAAMISKQASTNPLFQNDGIGFEKNDPIGQAYLGEGFQLHGIKLDSISNYQENTPVDSILSQINEWLFPVMIGEESKSVLIVDKMKDECRAGGIGGTEWAAELGKINKQWPRAQGYTPLLIKIYQAGTYLFTVPQKGSSNLTTIVYQKKGATESKDYSKLGNSYDVIKGLQSKIKGSQN